MFVGLHWIFLNLTLQWEGFDIFTLVINAVANRIFVKQYEIDIFVTFWSLLKNREIADLIESSFIVWYFQII